jgi:hypothetical protein
MPVEEIFRMSKIQPTFVNHIQSTARPTAIFTPAPPTLPAFPDLRHLNAKQRGELVEMMFMAQASYRGLIVSKPYGDSRRYDFITDTGQRLCRAQIKSTAHRSGNGFIVNATTRKHSREVYTARDIDFLIAYIIPRNAWYIVPVSELRTPTFQLYPDGCRRGSPYARFEPYREAWPLLGAPQTDRTPPPPWPIQPLPPQPSRSPKRPFILRSLSLVVETEHGKYHVQSSTEPQPPA